MSKIKFPTAPFLTALLLGLTCTNHFAQAQAPAGPRRAQAPNTIESPEVHSDRTVTFRVSAPKAADVSVSGEWMPANGSAKLTKDDQGVWSITVGPLEPNIYIYTFNVDGVTIHDPVNPYVKLRARGSASMVQVSGGQPWDFRDVPHGKVEINWHKSAVLDGAMRQIFVYTPPGYDRSRSTRYPILYLLHGSNDTAAGWSLAGNANLILDNLLAEKKVVPMIVVMAWGHALPFSARPGPNQPSNAELFEQYLLKEVMPMMESNYRITSGRKNRAIVGLSMGGNQALQIGLGHLDLFSSIGVFGAGISGAEFETRHKLVLGDATGTNKKLDLFLVGIGKDDPARSRARQLATALETHRIRHIYHETDGAHTYPVWRKLLVETAPRLFRKNGAAHSVAPAQIPAPASAASVR
jgi:enterochelin esterase-like enzyme